MKRFFERIVEYDINETIKQFTQIYVRWKGQPKVESQLNFYFRFVKRIDLQYEEINHYIKATNGTC